MPAPKGYVREDVLDKAIELFRKHGYTATSTAELVENLEINRKSLYAEFGSKPKLFVAALERYSDRNLGYALSPIEENGADLDSVERIFKGYASAAEGPFFGLGCLMANTAIERAALDPEVMKLVDAYWARLKAGFFRALNNAREKGQIKKSSRLDEQAAHLAMSVVGVSALVRAKVPSAEIHAACRALLVELN